MVSCLNHKDEVMTAWQVASLPVWGVSFAFVGVAIAVGLGVGRKATDTNADLMGQCAIGIVMGVPFLILSAWMWG
jgi:hypothetical protein